MWLCSCLYVYILGPHACEHMCVDNDTAMNHAALMVCYLLQVCFHIARISCGLLTISLTRFLHLIHLFIYPICFFALIL